MTDSEKEAAIARLAVRFEEYLDQGEDLWTTLARIAIEEAVVPALHQSHANIIESLKRSTAKEVYVDVRIPWSSVCAKFPPIPEDFK